MVLRKMGSDLKSYNSPVTLYGPGFVGGRYAEIYPDTLVQERDEYKPRSKKILFMISTVDNYNVHKDLNVDVDTNLRLLCDVLEHCRNEDIEFNFISSWFVYGKGCEVPAHEDDACNPTGFYSITKKCAEDLIKSFCDVYQMKYRILRLCNVMGHDPKASRQKNAIMWMINQLREHKPIALYDGGSHRRDVMHVDDVCRAIKTVIDDGDLNTTYNIGSGRPTSIAEIVDAAVPVLGSLSDIDTIDPPKFHKDVQTQDFYLDTTKLQKLGFKPSMDYVEIVESLCL
tara:strand:- start:1976 stop:2830 length:855 start_codon:yes stop_codon:yes gene_type:complete